MRIKTVGSVIACLTMGLSAFFGSITLQCVQLWMAVLIPRSWRWYIDITMYMWISNTVWLMEWLIGIRFRLFGDPIIENDRAIFIMNHRTRLDWLYFYGILMRYGWSLCDEKIVLKHELKRLPGAGWAMQCANYMFLRRNLQRDKFYLSNMLEYFCSLGHKTKILIFPEGTDLNSSSMDRSNTFASKTGLQKYKHVLHPRTAGFVHLVQEAIRYAKVNGESLDAIYDVTVAYPDQEFATNELGFLLGNSSSEVHFLCHRYSLKDIIGDDPADICEESQVSDKLRDFVVRKWEEKERRLQNYYDGSIIGDTPETAGTHHLNSHTSSTAAIDTNDLEPPIAIGDTSSVHRTFLSPERYLRAFIVRQWLSVFVISGNMILCVISMILIPKIFLPIVLILNGIFIYIDVFQFGVDDLVMRLALNDKYRIFSGDAQENETRLKIE